MEWSQYHRLLLMVNLLLLADLTWFNMSLNVRRSEFLDKVDNIFMKDVMQKVVYERQKLKVNDLVEVISVWRLGKFATQEYIKVS